MLGLLVMDQPVIQALQRDRLMRQDGGHRVGRLGHARVAEHDQAALGQHRKQLEFGPQHGDQGGFAAHQQPGDVEAMLGEQRVQVVPGHPARDVRVALPDLAGEVVAQPAQPPVDLGPPVTAPLDLRVLLVAGRPAPEPGAVIQQHLQGGDVVHHLAGALSGGPARVVADHPAERAVHVRRRLRAEAQAMGGRDFR